MTLKKIVSVLMVVLLAVSVMAGCEGRSFVVDKYDENPEIETLSSQVVAENERFTLEYNDEFKGIFLTNKATGKVWSNLTFDENNEPQATSTLNISLQEMNKYQSVFKYGIGPYENGKISVKKVDNGVELTYYFDDVKVSVPVKYTLSSDSMKMSIDASKIKEGHPLYRLVYAVPSPRLCEVNINVEDSYIFTPYGNGSMVSTKVTVDGERRYDGKPENYTSLDTSSSRDYSETARMPIYGMKVGEDAMFCIAEETPSSLGVTFSAGDKTSNYAIVYPNLYVADYDYFQARSKNSGVVRQISARTKDTITIGCYPLDGEDANYNGMADCYRNYLKKNGYLTESKIEKAPYSLTVMGGVMSTSSVMGIPVSTLKTLTTVADTEEIIGDVTETVGQKPIVVLKGYGESGINVGKIAGGYKIASEIGTEKEYKALLNYANDNKYSLFTDFEMLKYSESGNGFSYSRGAAKTAVLHAAEKFNLTVPLRQYDEKHPYHILSRHKTGQAVDKLIEFTDKIGISNISISTLGTVTYSDYYDEEKPYAIASKTGSEFKEYIKTFKESDKAVAGNASAYYAAGLLDVVFETDLEGDGSYQYEHQVPFYQMVFSGVTPMYTEAINLEAQPEKTIMQAATVGMGLGFTVVENFETSYMETNAEKLYGCVYDSVKDRIKEYVKDYSEVYAQIGGVKVENYEILENGVTVSTFANGKVVYANQTANTVETEVGTLGAYEFKLGGEEYWQKRQEASKLYAVDMVIPSFPTGLSV